MDSGCSSDQEDHGSLDVCIPVDLWVGSRRGVGAHVRVHPSPQTCVDSLGVGSRESWVEGPRTYRVQDPGMTPV